MYLYDNKQELFQWEINQKLIVENELVKEVHFSNAITPNALVVEVVEGTANIPNILLQNDFDIKAFGYCGQSVRESYIINVIGRTKPDDYIYTETELKTWETLKTDVETVKEDVETLKTDVETVKEETKENSLLLNTKPGLKFANGEIFNDYNKNYSENDYSHAEGTGTWASGKVFKVINAVPYLDNTGYIELDSKQGIEIGMIYSIVGEAAHHHCGKVIEMEKGSAYIKVENFPTNYQRNPKEDEKYSIHNYFMIDGHPELGTTEIGFAAHAEGYDTKATNTAAHAEGKETIVVGKYGHAEGKSTLAGHAAHAEGSNTIASGDASHAEGESTKAIGGYSHTEGINTKASALYAHAEGQNTIASGVSSHTEGTNTVASAKCSHAEGQKTEAVGFCSHAEGFQTKATSDYAHTEGQETEATSTAAHAEGFQTKATSQYAHAEGYLSEATGWISHAEGMNNKATAAYAHAEGNGTQAIGVITHTEGENTIANAKCGHAEGIGTVSNKTAQHVQGKYNIIDNTTNGYAHIVGNGTSDTNRKNIHTLDWNGNAWFSGSGEFNYIILKSSVSGSDKRFMLTINDNGSIVIGELK